MMHECQIEKKPYLNYANVEMYLIRCRCHEDAFTTWKSGDAEYVCPSERTDLSEEGKPKRGRPPKVFGRG